MTQKNGFMVPTQQELDWIFEITIACAHKQGIHALIALKQSLMTSEQGIRGISLQTFEMSLMLPSGFMSKSLQLLNAVSMSGNAASE
ncbi:hypothetical protein PSTEL_13180 [Paenibacillus stellifer]|uniref:Uncharacterized protein n=1 Tax=Paenibacillus stellifer TaxID=169760 RepID=A0A089LXF9_9BACL|nr:hypothetical protein [Paenibacillus stellifer]AIQ63893.1 hypothetical protein PSTEL_13180 [Paenibacillus stellifer]